MDTATSESTFFIEQEEVFNLIDIISSSSISIEEIDTISTQQEQQLPTTQEALFKLRSILDRYLECPTLLDPYLETMVQKLSLPARSIVHELYLSLTTTTVVVVEEGECCTQNSTSNVAEKLNTLMHLLSAIYAISKVRGRKYIQRLMPHEAADTEPVLVVLRWFGWIESQDRVSSTSVDDHGMPNEIIQFQKQYQKKKDNAEAKVWESVYSLLLWLGIISLVPFDLNTIDSSIEPQDEDNNNNNTTNTMTLVQSILTTSSSHLSDYGATRETAAACLASLLSRPDLEQSELEGFVNWSAHILYWFRTGKMYCADEMPDQSSSSLLLPIPKEAPSVFLVMGVLQTLSAIFKTGHRSNLLSTQQKLRGIEFLWEQSILVAEGRVGGSLILRKLLVKLFARIGCAYLPPRVASWRYQRGKRSLVENLLKGKDGSKSSTTVNIDELKASCNDNQLDSSAQIFQIPDQVEDAMDQLLRSLTDSATVVRWSAAKGIGRLTERLPAICADDVLDALLQLCIDNTDRDQAWHGACLALAELARRGLLLPARLGEVVPIVVQAIGYDVRRGNHSVGTHVRDASCYVCWAFARAYSPTVLKPYVRALSVALVLTSLFDREVNCRRAASAAFQESVGRQGADNFPHGIAILTTANYYSLGNRSDSFLTLALDIAKFEEYQTQIIRHLADVKLLHWDIEIRSLSSRSLARVSRLNPSYSATNVLPKLLEQCFSDDLVVRHGSLLGVAEIVLAFGEANQVDVLNADIKSLIAELVPSIEKARLYRGRGGEIMRSAACRMIECISLARIPLTVKQQVRLLDSVDACLVHPKEDIQKSAVKALNALLTYYFPVSVKGPSSRLQSRVVDKYISIVQLEDNPAATRGFSLALGSLPAKLLAPNCQVLDSVINCLCIASKRTTLVGGEGDAETRRNAIVSLVNVCTTVVGKTSSSQVVALPPIYRLERKQTDQVFSALLEAMEDYNTDRRGDVGSWSRIAAMDGLESLSYLSIKATTTFPYSRGDLTSSETPVYVPAFQKRLDNLPTPLENVDSLSKSHKEERTIFFDEQLCSSVLCALMKQLAEKLDTIRCKAGECLERLLTSSSPRLPFVPYRRILVQALSLNGQDKNWSDPALTFPLLMKTVNINDFAEPILSGIVVSVGGLTESVSKSSSTALFEWIRGLRSAKATSKLFRMGEVFIGLFHKNKRNGRVLLPLLFTLDKLISHGYLDELLSAENGTFLSSLMVCLESEANGCSDVKRLLAIVTVALSLLRPHLQTVDIMRKKILPFIMTMLLNPYPRVRRYTAEELYVVILSQDDGGILFGNHDCLEEANQLLLSVVWHEENDPRGHIAESRNRIAELLGIPLTDSQRNVKVGKQNNNSRKTAPRDEFESYSSLLGAG